jgi:hypothetical protein
MALIRRALGAGAAVALAGTAMLVMATPASAHTWDVKAKCDAANEVTYLEVDLRSYAGGGKNSIVVTDNGEVVFEEDDFGTDLKGEDGRFEFEATVEHVFEVVVVAHDDDPAEENNKDWSFEWT